MSFVLHAVALLLVISVVYQATRRDDTGPLAPAALRTFVLLVLAVAALGAVFQVIPYALGG